MTLSPVVLTSITDELVNPFASFVPRLVSAIVVLIVGLILVRFIARALRSAFETAKLDALGERTGFADSLERIGLGRAVTPLVVGTLKFFLTLFVVVIAVGVLGVSSLEEPINQLVLFIPRAIVALVIIGLGVAAAGSVRKVVDRLGDQLGIKGPLGTLAEIVVIAVFVLVGAGLAGIPTSIFLLLLAVLLGGIALTAALAFGFGSREVARQITSGRYIGDDISAGQTISVGDISGEVVRMETTAIILRASDGRIMRVPNSRLVDEVVTFPDDPSGGPPTGPRESPY
jgi:small-conductance mechanosensitive channel